MKNYAGWLVAVMVLTCVTVQGQDVEREGRRGWKPREGDGPPPHLRQDCKRPGPHGGDPLGCMDGLVGRIIHHKEIQEKLGLTETQVEKLRKRFFASREKLIDLRAELAKAGMRQARLMTADPVDEEALMQAVEQAGRARTGIAKVRVRQLVEIREILTEEQLDRARAALRERMRERPRGRRRDRRPERE